MGKEGQEEKTGIKYKVLQTEGEVQIRSESGDRETGCPISNWIWYHLAPLQRTLHQCLGKRIRLGIHPQPPYGGHILQSACCPGFFLILHSESGQVLPKLQGQAKHSHCQSGASMTPTDPILPKGLQAKADQGHKSISTSFKPPCS